MIDVEYRKEMFKLMIGLGAGYWIDVACERKNTDSFQTEDALWEFTKGDQWMYFGFTIGKSYTPDTVEISSDKIGPSIVSEMGKVALVFRHMKAPM
jgi:hypothetical protein